MPQGAKKKTFDGQNAFFPRIDRYATLYLFYPVLRRAWRRALRIPILMYHSVSSEADHSVSPYYQTTTTPDVFAAQMLFLKENGYSSIGLDEAASLLENGAGPAKGKAVVITFDDGYMDFYDEAFPVLKHSGLNATVFLSTGFNDKAQSFCDRECLSWAKVRELASMGTVFGSHTVNHLVLKTLSGPQVEFELRRSKETIEDRTGAEVTSFSYPYAFPEEQKDFTASLRRSLRRCGYKNGVSTIIGTASPGDDVYFLKRIPVNLHDDIRLFEAKLCGAYDWVHELQFASKYVRHRIMN